MVISSLPADCLLRPACAEDAWSIRRLVFSAMLDPTQLRWSQFWIIECKGKLVACGQLREFSDAQELGSLVVAAEWRDRGLGSYLTQHLIQQATQPLYLECVGDLLAKFYDRFGFVPIAPPEFPASLKLKFGFSKIVSTLLPLISVTHMEYRS